MVWAEAFSQIQLATLGALTRYFLLGGKFIISGDQWQLSGPFDIHGDAMQRLPENSCFKTLCNCVGWEFTESRRAQGPLAQAHFTYYCSLNNLPEGLLGASALMELRRRFPWQGQMPDYVLCVSNKSRELFAMSLLAQHAVAKRGEPHVDIFPGPVKGAPLRTHTMMRLWVGLELMGCRRTARPKGVCNGCLYTVTELGDNIKLSDGVNEISLSKEQVGEQLRYSWARTYYGVQGYTFDRRVLLMDTGHVHFRRRHAYVAVSRARDPEKATCLPHNRKIPSSNKPTTLPNS